MLRRFAYVFRHNRSLRWLAGYVLAIFLFAGVYWLLPLGAFYFPTAPFEPSTGKYFDQLKSELTAVLNLSYISPDSLTLVATHGWRAVMGRAAVEDIVLPEGYLRGGRLHHHDDIPLELHIAIPIENRSVGTGVVRCVSTLNVASDALLMSFKLPARMPDSLDFRKADVVTFLPTRLDGVAITTLRMGIAEPPTFDKRTQGYFLRQVLPGGDMYGPAITLPYKPKILMFKYVRAMLGFPSDPYDNFLRMVYLSAVTLTTLGYGDIVPLTSWSRGITALEAVLGILIVGMFLNSVAGNFVKRWTTPSG